MDNALCSDQRCLGEDEKLCSESSIERRSAQCCAESLDVLSDDKKILSKSQNTSFDGPQNNRSHIAESEDSSFPAENLFFAPSQPESSFITRDFLQEEVCNSTQNFTDEDEEMTWQSSCRTNDSQYVNENPAPFNLLQDSWNLTLSRLPSHHRQELENLISKINYQINYFKVIIEKKLKSTKVILFCDVCNAFLSISGVEKHTRKQEHLHNLSELCKRANETSIAGEISLEDWEFLEFDECFQCYQCSLCEVNLSDSRSSWKAHFQSNPHLSKLKASKPEAPTHPISASARTSSSESDEIGGNCLNNSSEIDSVSLLTTQTKQEINSFRVITELLCSTDKQAFRSIKRHLNDDVNYFKPSYEDESGKLHLICKVCRESLLLKKVITHASSESHLENAEKYSSFVNLTATLSDTNEKIVQDLRYILKDDMNNFEPYESVFDQLFFICIVCRENLHPKNIRSHSFTTYHRSNLNKKSRKSHVNANPIVGTKIIEVTRSSFTPQSSTEAEISQKSDLNAQLFNDSDKKVILDLTDKLKGNMKYFKPFYESESNELYFTCKACSLPLTSKNVRSHIYITSHLQNVRQSLLDVKRADLNAEHEKAVKKLLRQFNCQFYYLYVFQLKRDNLLNELWLFCQVCNAAVSPEDVKCHVDSETHSTNLQTNPFSLNLVSLKESNKMMVRDVIADIQDKIDDFDLVYRIGTEELRFNCKYCLKSFMPCKVKNHVQSSNHLEAVSE